MLVILQRKALQNRAALHGKWAQSAHFLGDLVQPCRALCALQREIFPARIRGQRPLIP